MIRPFQQQGEISNIKTQNSLITVVVYQTPLIIDQKFQLLTHLILMNKKSLSEVTGLADPLKDILGRSVAVANDARDLFADKQQINYYKAFPQVQTKFDLLKNKITRIVRKLEGFVDDSVDVIAKNSDTSMKVVRPEKCIEVLDLYTDAVEIYLKKCAEEAQKIRVKKQRQDNNLNNKQEQELRPQFKYNLQKPEVRKTILQELDYDDINSEIRVTLSRPMGETPFVEVSTEDSFHQMLRILQASRQVAVDLEHSDKSYTGFTCLMQISTREHDFVVDVFPVWSLMPKLNSVFNNPKILKVFHGSESDIVWLHRDFDIRVSHLFDTYQAARIIGHSRLSYAYLLKHYTGTDTDKKYQLADWRMRPLPEQMITYARMDTHYLLEIYDKLKQDLLNKASERQTDYVQLLKTVFSHSADVANKIYEGEDYRNSKPYLQTMWKHRKTMHESRATLLEELFRYRDELAKEVDENADEFFSRKIIFEMLDKKSYHVAQVLKSFRKEEKKLKDLVPRIAKHIQEFVENQKSRVAEKQNISNMEIEQPNGNQPATNMEIEEPRLGVKGVNFDEGEAQTLYFEFDRYTVSFVQLPIRTFDPVLSKSAASKHVSLNFECPVQFQLAQFQIRMAEYQDEAQMQVEAVQEKGAEIEQNEEGAQEGEVDRGILYLPKVEGAYDNYRKPVSKFKEDNLPLASNGDSSQNALAGKFEADKGSNKKRKEAEYQERMKKGNKNLYSYLDDED